MAPHHHHHLTISWRYRNYEEKQEEEDSAPWRKGGMVPHSSEILQIAYSTSSSCCFYNSIDEVNRTIARTDCLRWDTFAKEFKYRTSLPVYKASASSLPSPSSPRGLNEVLLQLGEREIRNFPSIDWRVRGSQHARISLSSETLTSREILHRRLECVTWYLRLVSFASWLPIALRCLHVESSVLTNFGLVFYSNSSD